MGKYTGQRYCPSNGTAGEMFSSRFCEQCTHEKFIHTGVHGDKQCDILNRSIIHDRDDKLFPTEWQYDLNDNPTCIAFKKWDWSQGDPEEVPIPDPNQISLEL